MKNDFTFPSLIKVSQALILCMLFSQPLLASSSEEEEGKNATKAPFEQPIFPLEQLPGFIIHRILSMQKVYKSNMLILSKTIRKNLLEQSDINWFRRINSQESLEAYQLENKEESGLPWQKISLSWNDTFRDHKNFIWLPVNLVAIHINSKSTAEELGLLATALKTYPNLREIALNGIKRLPGNDPTTPHLKTILESHRETLTCIDVMFAGLTDGDIKELAPAIGQCTNLTILRLPYNLMSQEGIKTLAPHLSPRLKELSLDGTENEMTIGNAGLQAIQFTALKNLEFLTIETNGLTPDALGCLRPLKLKILAVSENNLHGGLGKLMDALSNSTELNHLSLSRSHLTQEDVGSLMDLLKAFKHLGTINLDGNPLGNGIAIQLPDIFPTHRALEFINLDNTGITDYGMGNLNQGCKEAPESLRIMLANNGITTRPSAPQIQLTYY